MDGNALVVSDDRSDLPRADHRLIACLVPPAEVGAVWAKVAPHLERALKRSGEYSAEDARAAVEAGRWGLWIAARPGELVAAAVTEVVEYPRKTVLWLYASGGSRIEGVLAMWPRVRQFAAARGCTEMRFLGRRGWARSGRLPAGWQHVSDVVRVEV